MSLKITLVYPGISFHASPPLGIGYIAAVLMEKGYPVDVIDFNVAGKKEGVRKKIEKSKPDIVGFSVMTTFVEEGLEWAKIIKRLLPNTIIVFGGPHASVMPIETLSNPSVDICVIGEGEYTMLDLVRAIEERRSLREVEGIYFKEDGEIIKNKRREFVNNLDLIPFPARDLLSMESYLFNMVSPPYIVPMTHIIVNRGCPFNCNFCQPTSHIMWGQRARYRSPESVCDEIEFLADKYMLKSINIGGDTFTVNKEWVKSFCKEMKRRKVTLPWFAAARIGTVNYELLKEMKEAGCISVGQGVESGSQRILNILNKGITTDQIKDYFRWCRQLKIVTVSNYMIGSPEETLETMDESLRMMKETRPDYFGLYVTNPIPGTHLYDFAAEQGLLNFRSFSDINRHHIGNLKLKYIDEDDIKRYWEKMYNLYLRLKLSYIFNPFTMRPYLISLIFRRIFSFRKVRGKAIQKAYEYMYTYKVNPLKKIKEIIIKAI